jgi:uroporphyrinogen decarboxylase
MNASGYWKGPIKAEPDFGNVLKVLRRGRPDRPVLMELFMNGPLNERVVGPEKMAGFQGSPWAGSLSTIHAFRALGYDYATLRATDMAFPSGEHAQQKTRSLNEGALVTDRASFERYPWPDPASFTTARLDNLENMLLPGMKAIIIAPGGVLENAIRIVGYDNLCVMLFEDPGLAADVFAEIGTRLLAYYRAAVACPAVGAVWANDDWGFKTQTMLSPADMRKYVFPWHRKIAEVAHAAGKPTILHSCGRLDEVMEDVIATIGHDGKHSYEDSIRPVEEAYEQLVGRIAVVGGLDVDFVCRSTPGQVYARARAMLERAEDRGGYALGTGNSVPEYVPQENYFAMLAAAWDRRAGR